MTLSQIIPTDLYLQNPTYCACKSLSINFSCNRDNLLSSGCGPVFTGPVSWICFHSIHLIKEWVPHVMMVACPGEYTRTHNPSIVCLLWAARGTAWPQRWLIYSLLLSVKRLTDGKNSVASATLSPPSSAALRFQRWQEFWGLLLSFDGKVISNHKSVRVG